MNDASDKPYSNTPQNRDKPRRPSEQPPRAVRHFPRKLELAPWAMTALADLSANVYKALS